eukprot:3358693-Rhodomonas_salina.2
MTAKDPPRAGKMRQGSAVWLFVVLSVSLGFLGSASGQEVCMTGYIMDTYCVDRGTLLDNPSLKTLERPGEHSIHCLVDVSVCRGSGFEVLADPPAGQNMSASSLPVHQLRVARC